MEVSKQSLEEIKDLMKQDFLNEFEEWPTYNLKIALKYFKINYNEKFNQLQNTLQSQEFETFFEELGKEQEITNEEINAINNCSGRKNAEFLEGILIANRNSDKQIHFFDFKNLKATKNQKQLEKSTQQQLQDQEKIQFLQKCIKNEQQQDSQIQIQQNQDQNNQNNENFIQNNPQLEINDQNEFQKLLNICYKVKNDKGVDCIRIRKLCLNDINIQLNGIYDKQSKLQDDFTHFIQEKQIQFIKYLEDEQSKKKQNNNEENNEENNKENNYQNEEIKCNLSNNENSGNNLNDLLKNEDNQKALQKYFQDNFQEYYVLETIQIKLGKSKLQGGYKNESKGAGIISSKLRELGREYSRLFLNKYKDQLKSLIVQKIVYTTCPFYSPAEKQFRENGVFIIDKQNLWVNSYWPNRFKKYINSLQNIENLEWIKP